MVDIVFDGTIATTGVILNGGTTLANYAEGTWTPTFDFATTGDLSMAYATQNGTYTRTGRTVYITCDFIGTPTYTTASGTASILGVPFTVGERTVGSPISHGAGLTYATGTTSAASFLTTTFIQCIMNGSTKTGALASTTEIPSGTQQIWKFSATYII
jgi:hypothetical protein